MYELEKNPSTVGAHNVKLSDLAGRLDASYHVPIVDTTIEHLKQHAEEVTTVGDPHISQEVILPGRFKRVYVDEGYGRVLIGGKQLSELDPSSKKYLSPFFLAIHKVFLRKNGFIRRKIPRCWSYFRFSDRP